MDETDFEGTLVLVSHDRHLLRATTDQFLIVADGRLKPFDGDLEDYREWLLKSKQAKPPAAAPAGGRELFVRHARKDGKVVAGLGKLTEEGARSAWMIYYTVTDADATTRTVEEAGGTVRVAPRDLGDWGRMAQYNDSLGGQFAVWQPGKNAGFELADEPGSLSWTELYTSDAAAAYSGSSSTDASALRMSADRARE